MNIVALTPRLAHLLKRDLAVPRGGLGSAGARKTTEAIENRMTIEASNMTKMFYAVLAIIISAFLAMLYLLIVNANNPAAFTAISSASGLTLGGLIWLAVRTAREANQASLLLVLVANLPSDDALAALEAVLKAGNSSSVATPALKKETHT